MGSRNRFNPCFPCCEDNSPCEYCTTSDSERTITLDNFTFDCCDYGDEPVANGAFVLSQPSPLSLPCHYHGFSEYVTCRDPYVNFVQAWIDLDVVELDNGNYGWRCEVLIDAVMSIWWEEYRCTDVRLTFEWDSGDTTPFDCTAARTLTLVDIEHVYGDGSLAAFGNLENVTCELT